MTRESNTRYEVEVQLGASDESHIIRTIEYWDIERRRYPQYDHVGVIIAEEITARFFNVISLFNGFIPLIAIQLNVIELADAVTLFSRRFLIARPWASKRWRSPTSHGTVISGRPGRLATPLP